MTATQNRVGRTQPATRHEEDHRELERFLDDVVRALDGDYDPRTFTELWSSFAAHMAAHLRHEEEDLFQRVPPYHDLGPLWRDHEELREELLLLTADLRIDALRPDAVRAFLEHLRVHAERENTLAYAWASWDLQR